MPVNQLAITGTVLRHPRSRENPAGIALTSFTLEHRSRQCEAGLQRDVFCRIVVMACGRELVPMAQSLRQGESIYVAGFLGQQNYRTGEARLVLHAHSIDRPSDAQY